MGTIQKNQTSQTQKKVAVVLGGCGYKDGSEIHESVMALWALYDLGAQVQCFAPDKPQAMVVNHLDLTEQQEERSLLAESARIARSQIKPLSLANEKDFDAVVIPGGFGAALNLSTFGAEGENMRVDGEVEAFLTAMHNAGKPIGAICIAPVILAKLFGRKGVRLTIGTEVDVAHKLERLGCQHVPCTADDCVVDADHKLVTTPAYMLAEHLGQFAPGVRKLVEHVLLMCS